MSHILQMCLPLPLSEKSDRLPKIQSRSMVGTVFFHVLIIEELPIWHGFHGEHFLVRSLRFHAAFCRDNQQLPYLTQMLTLPLKRFHYGDFPKFSGCSWYSVRSLESQEMCLSISWTNCVFWLIFFNETHSLSTIFVSTMVLPLSLIKSSTYSCLA